MRTSVDVVGAGCAGAIAQLAADVDDVADRVGRQVQLLTAVRAHQLQRLGAFERTPRAAANHSNEHREVPA
ncbi:MAG TPA: hypothetical protein VHB25_08625 [Gemmatimonadaceae bacterium]|nr:hypothetical protein [Gemmatimonadaceae bacterium]